MQRKGQSHIHVERAQLDWRATPGPNLSEVHMLTTNSICAAQKWPQICSFMSAGITSSRESELR